MTSYAELAVTTPYSFLRGASPSADLVLRAIEIGHAGIGIADRNTVAGVVRAYEAWRTARDAFVAHQAKAATVSPDGAPAQEARQEDAPFPFKLAVGARLAFIDGTPDILAYPAHRDGWGRLCRLLTEGKRRARKGECHLALDDLLADTKGLLLIAMPPRRLDALDGMLARLAPAARRRVWLAAAMHRRGDDRRRLMRLKDCAARARVPLVAVNDALYAVPADRDLQDVVTCIREKTTIAAAGRRLEANAERHLKSPAEMLRLFKDAPEAVAETAAFLNRVKFSLADLAYEYPDEPVPAGWSPQGWLEELTRRRAAVRYPHGVPAKVERLLAQELALIDRLGYARYFLTIHDIVRFAEGENILCQGRGSAANSAVCYVLGITAVDPAESQLLFARFISEERKEPPDIDVDFEHERREEVIQHIYKRYTNDRAGIVATVISYRPRSAIRDVGKVFGLTEDVTAALAGTVWGGWGTDIPDAQVRQAGLDPKNPVIRRAVTFAQRLLGFPRHLSQHVGGFILTRGRLDELVPIGNAAMEKRTFIEWDKDDIDVLGLMKVDVLALGMLTCIRKAFDLMRAHGCGDYNLASVPSGQGDVYAMLRKGDSIGVFQVESRAQINMLPRLAPEEFYDLVIQVAIVRPGPIQGDMVHPYLQRRKDPDLICYPSPAPPHPQDELIHVLSRTKGVPLFQEQAMQLAMTAAEFTDIEANGLRRAMASFRQNGKIEKFQELMIERMVARGYERAFAERCFNQIKGFGEYGFPESHAASFAKLVYISAFIKCRYPAVFACALLNAQPMGFYAPAQIVRDAREHGVEVRMVDVNASLHDNTLEPCRVDPDSPRHDRGLALRLGFRQIDGFSEDWSKQLVEARGTGYGSVEELAVRSGLPHRALRRLADADAMRSLAISSLGTRSLSTPSLVMRSPERDPERVRPRSAPAFEEDHAPTSEPERRGWKEGFDRRAALWAVRRLPDAEPLPLFAAADARELAAEPDPELPEMPLGEHVATDYQTLRLSLKAHPMQVLRPLFRAEGALSCKDAATAADGARVRVAGVVLIRQRPGKGNAIFITLEDETGIVNVVLWTRQFERFRRAVMGSRLMLVEGRIQRSPEGVVHLMAGNILDRSAALAQLSETPAQAMPLSRADEVARPQEARGPRHPRNVRILPRSRDFH